MSLEEACFVFYQFLEGDTKASLIVDPLVSVTASSLTAGTNQSPSHGPRLRTPWPEGSRCPHTNTQRSPAQAKPLPVHVDPLSRDCLRWTSFRGTQVEGEDRGPRGCLVTARKWQEKHFLFGCAQGGRSGAILLQVASSGIMSNSLDGV